MEVFDKNLTDQITSRDNKNDITDVTYWNRLSIDEHDPKFDEEFKKVISYDGISDAPCTYMRMHAHLLWCLSRIHRRSCRGALHFQSCGSHLCMRTYKSIHT